MSSRSNIQALAANVYKSELISTVDHQQASKIQIQAPITVVIQCPSSHSCVLVDVPVLVPMPLLTFLYPSCHSYDLDVLSVPWISKMKNIIFS